MHLRDVANKKARLLDKARSDIKTLERLHARAINDQLTLAANLASVHAECSRQVEEIRVLRAARPVGKCQCDPCRGNQ